MKIVLAGAFYPNYFTWKISDEELSLRQMSGLDATTTVMVRVLYDCLFVMMAVLLVNSCQGYRHTPTSIRHCCVKCLVFMEKAKLFILMAQGSVWWRVCIPTVEVSSTLLICRCYIEYERTRPSQNRYSSIGDARNVIPAVYVAVKAGWVVHFIEGITL